MLLDYMYNLNYEQANPKLVQIIDVPLYQYSYHMYRIVGNFGEVFNLANWRFYGRSPNLKSAIFYSDEN